MARNLNRGLGIDFQPGLQEGLVSNRGADMIHEIGIACPSCRTDDLHANMTRDGESQQRRPFCSVCGGDGWLFRDPVLVRGLAVGITQRTEIMEWGEGQPGTMQFSIGPGFLTCGDGNRRVTRDDKFTATWDQPLNDGQTIIRGAATLDDNVRLDNNVRTDEDRLWYEPGTALWCEDENQVVYKQNVDFRLGPGRVIQWYGNSPLVGTKYTLKYTAFFEWIVFAPPQERRDRDNRDLGPLVTLQRRHVQIANDSPYILDTDRVPLSDRMAC